MTGIRSRAFGRAPAEHSDDLDDVNDLLRMAELAKHEAKAYSQNTSRDKNEIDKEIFTKIIKEMRKLTRALIKAKKMADEQSHDSKELYELTVRVKQVLHMADTTET
ncbi:hypothetical protein DYB32_000560 [Aphanomyces invadans]|uniref:Uncharacterized protein n=1 Tax=Aphanomyces invadans TaxID=157072 RepID=A0A3R6ZAU6_9STRA|nr:hypothetical protein DYB32_000560 [Aphanomyces invadans]